MGAIRIGFVEELVKSVFGRWNRILYRESEPSQAGCADGYEQRRYGLDAAGKILEASPNILVSGKRLGLHASIISGPAKDG